MNEKEIINAIISGDTEAYRQLVERYQTGLIIHCDQMLLDRDSAEDTAQQAFIKAYEQLRRYDPNKAGFSTWLYRIASNLCIDHLRRQRKFTALPKVDLPAEDNLSQAEVDHIRKIVNELQPPEYSQVIKAYFWEGKGYKQIAQELNTTTGTVGTWISRAKTQLRRELL